MFIYYVRLDTNLDSDNIQLLRKQLPANLVSRNQKFRNTEDQQRNLLGLILLRYICKQHLDLNLDFSELRTTRYRRPYLLNSKIDFNISHAGDYVICAVSPDSRIGIDIEQQVEVNFDEYDNTMNEQQWDEIQSSPQPFSKFFRNWCIKESVIKADGRGLSIPLTSINIEQDQVSYADKKWHIKPFKIDAVHFGCLACEHPISDLNLTEVHWKVML